MAKKLNGKIKSTITISNGNKKVVKPKLGKGTGGVFTARIINDVKEKEKNNG